MVGGAGAACTPALGDAPAGKPACIHQPQGMHPWRMPCRSHPTETLPTGRVCLPNTPLLSATKPGLIPPSPHTAAVLGGNQEGKTSVSPCPYQPWPLLLLSMPGMPALADPDTSHPIPHPVVSLASNLRGPTVPSTARAGTALAPGTPGR